MVPPLSGPRLDVSITKGPVVTTTPSIITRNSPVTYPIDTKGIWAYRVTFSSTVGLVMFSYEQRRGVFPELFSIIPGVILALAIANLAFVLYLRPRQDKFKQAAIYSGEFRTRIDSGERLYSEYKRMTPVPAQAAVATPAPAAPAPVVSPYSAAPVSVNPVITNPVVQRP